MATKQQTARDELTEVQGLYALGAEPLPFAPSHDIRAFLLRRARGNLLLYSTTKVRADAPAVRQAGAITRHYLNHSHEALFASERVDAPVFVHEAERQAVGGRYRIRGTFSRRHMLDEDFEVIPAPGHTPGATAYRWDSGRQRVLFTGDTIYLQDGEWVAAVLSSSDREAYIHSLELIAELEFDVLAPWAATRGQLPYAITGRADARRRIGAIVARLRSGGDH
ncbi:MAG TPA: MBL fold metallo-hydrolase [Solirubrobacteraceae bacterium]|nr:MBL fold metallo-hydrolase [Solirubrobacteraceae bacterium]